MCSRYTLPTRASGKIRTQLAPTLPHDSKGSFNTLPNEVQDIPDCSVNKFKAALDRFHRTVPQEPPVSGYTAVCRTASNSVPDQVQMKRQDGNKLQNSGGPPQLCGTKHLNTVK